MAAFSAVSARIALWRRPLGFILALVSALAISPPAIAADDVFTVANVAVDATAATAAAARERAIQDGQRRAFARLVERLAPASERPRVPRLSDAAIADLVRDFEIGGEKTSSVRYIANLTVRFKPVQVRALLRGSGVAFSETPSKPVLVLPVLDSGSGPTLFDDSPWRQAWLALVPGDGLVPFVLPRDDADDVATIAAEEAVAGDDTHLKAIAARYGVTDVLVAVARVRPDETSGLDSLDVSASRFGTPSSEENFVATFAPEAADAPDAVFGRAAAAVAGRIEEGWKQATILHFGSEQEISARIPLGDLDRLVTVLRALDGVAPIERVDLVRVNRDEAEVRLRFLGDEDQLGLFLAQRNLALSRDPAGLVLQPAASVGGRQ